MLACKGNIAFRRSMENSSCVSTPLQALNAHKIDPPNFVASME